MTRCRWAKPRYPAMLGGVALSLCSVGCVEQLLTVTSEPAGALVTLNDKEFGRTPATRDFTWYGKYDVELERPGYQSLRTTGQVTAVWWNWIPLDLFADLLPIHLVDHRSLHYTLKPEGGIGDMQALAQRGRRLGEKLGPPMPANLAATRPSTQPAK